MERIVYGLYVRPARLAQLGNVVRLKVGEDGVHYFRCPPNMGLKVGNKSKRILFRAALSIIKYEMGECNACVHRDMRVKTGRSESLYGLDTI